MAEQKAKVIPGIPLAALDAIQDQNVRDVLRALVDAHHVRNGNSGNGNQRFITAEEAGLVGGRSSILGGGGSGQSVVPTQKPNTITPSQIGRIINDLQAQIIESPLFKDLGDRITLIDGPTGLVYQFNVLKDGVTNLTTVTNDSITQINGIKLTVYDPVTGLPAAQSMIGEINNISDTSTSAAAKQISLVRSVVFDPFTGLPTANANISAEKTTRANSDNALASAVNTIWAVVGDNNALVQEGSNVIVNNAGAVAERWNQTQVAIKDPVTGLYINSATVREESKAAFNKAGALEAKYTVKIDLNGYVTGFGLAATANNGQTFSEFYIRADRFAIGSPQINRSPNAEGIYPPADPAQIPFIVKTNGSYVNGVWAPPGTYMTNAFIENGSITYAKIGLAEIDTLLLKGNAVVVPSSAMEGIHTAVTSVWKTVLECVTDFGAVAPTLVICTATVNFIAMTGGTSSSLLMRICQDSVPSPMETGISLTGGFAGVSTVSSSFTTTPGIHRYQVQVYQAVGSTSYNAGARNITVMGAKR